ncbi:MAG: hypothetical protein JO285_13160 [Kutzneria sp.]|nr:hypothetical protein [Kutzneria sp.]
MADMSVTWTFIGTGWARIIVADQRAEASVVASGFPTAACTTAAEDFLTAVVRLVRSEDETRVQFNETRVQFNAEPTAFRWIFYREGNDVWIRVLRLSHGLKHDNAGTEIWSSWQTVDTLARAVIRCFDEVARTYGESGYRGKWMEHFPRSELEALRTAWRVSLSDLS